MGIGFGYMDTTGMEDVNFKMNYKKALMTILKHYEYMEAGDISTIIDTDDLTEKEKDIIYEEFHKYTNGE